MMVLKGELIGKVIGTKDKTLTVLVSTKRKHPRYEKFVTYKKKFQVHNPENRVYEIDSNVAIVPCKKISKTKSYVILEQYSALANI